MTLDEAKKIAEEVLNGQTESYVRAAHELAEFVASLVPGVNVIEIERARDTEPPDEPFQAAPSVIPIAEGELESEEDVVPVSIDTTGFGAEPPRDDEEDELELGD